MFVLRAIFGLPQNRGCFHRNWRLLSVCPVQPGCVLVSGARKMVIFLWVSFSINLKSSEARRCGLRTYERGAGHALGVSNSRFRGKTLTDAKHADGVPRCCSVLPCESGSSIFFKNNNQTIKWGGGSGEFPFNSPTSEKLCAGILTCQSAVALLLAAVAFEAPGSYSMSTAVRLRYCGWLRNPCNAPPQRPWKDEAAL